MVRLCNDDDVRVCRDDDGYAYGACAMYVQVSGVCRRRVYDVAYGCDVRWAYVARRCACMVWCAGVICATAQCTYGLVMSMATVYVYGYDRLGVCVVQRRCQCDNDCMCV